MAKVQPPAAKGDAPASYDTVGELEKINDRIGDAETGIANSNRDLREVRDTNRLIIIVLFGIVVSLVFMVIYDFINTIKADTASRDDLTKAVMQLDIELKEKSTSGSRAS